MTREQQIAAIMKKYQAQKNSVPKTPVEKAIDKEVRKLTKPELKKIASQIKRDLEKKSISAIANFYADYNPEKYNRKYAMPFIINDATIKETADGWLVDIRYTTDDLYSWHGAKTEYVFDGPFIQGYHGGPIRGGSAPISIPSPWNAIRDYAVYMYNAIEY